MDWAEQHAEKYLRARSADVVHEPDGNIPPDFLVDGKIAVEVRRLIQHEDFSGLERGLGETSIPIWQGLERLLEKLGKPHEDGLSWWVFLNFRRPVSRWPQLRPKIFAALQSFKEHENAVYSFPIEPNLEIEIRRASITDPQRFMPGGFHDENSGGWLLSEVRRNLKICIADKNAKVAPHQSKYGEWWLVLIDHIGYSLSHDERKRLKSFPLDQSFWNKVILVNPTDETQAFEI